MRYCSSPFGRVPLLGMGETTPPDYSFPTAETYTQQLSQGIKDATSFSTDDLGIVMTPAGKSVSGGIKTLLEAAGGGDLSSIIIGAIMPDAPPMLASMLKDLLDNVLDVVISAVGQSIAEAIGGACSSIPLVGFFFGKLVEAIGLLADSTKEADRIADALDRAKGTAHKAHYEHCSWWLSHSVNTCPPATGSQSEGNAATSCPGSIGMTELCTAIGTGEGSSITPSDMFRPIAYNLTPNGRNVNPSAPGIPWCPTACYVWLCGGEAPIGLGRAKYDTLLAKARSLTGDPKLGLPKEIQRAMWSLISGICASTNDPDPTKMIKPWGEQGRGLYPLLTDMIWRSWKPVVEENKFASEGYWDDTLLRVIAEDQALNYQSWGTFCDPDGNCTQNFYRNSCAEYADIIGVYNKAQGQLGATGFVSHIRQYGNYLKSNFVDSSGKIVGHPVSESGIRLISSSVSRAIVSVNYVDPKTAKDLVSPKVTGSQKAILAAGGLGGSYLAYRGIKAAAHLIRSR